MYVPTLFLYHKNRPFIVENSAVIEVSSPEGSAAGTSCEIHHLQKNMFLLEDGLLDHASF